MSSNFRFPFVPRGAAPLPTLACALVAMSISLGPATVASAQSITISNGIPGGDPNHLSIVVGMGSASTTMVVGTSFVLFERYAVLDLGSDGVHALGAAITVFGAGSAPVLVAPNTVQTTATLNVASGQIDVTITTSIAANSSYVLTEYDIEADYDLTGRLFEYADLDVIIFPANAFSFSGSIAGEDLVLSQSFSGLTVERSDPGQTATGFATDFFFTLGATILAGGFDPPQTGSVLATFGDITSALEYEIDDEDEFYAVTAMGRNVPTDDDDDDDDNGDDDDDNGDDDDG